MIAHLSMVVGGEGDLLNGSEHVLIRAVIPDAEDEVWGGACISCLQQNSLDGTALGHALRLHLDNANAAADIDGLI